MLPHIHGWIAFAAIVLLLLVVDLQVVHREPLRSMAVITAILAVAVTAPFMSTRRPATVSTPESDDP